MSHNKAMQSKQGQDMLANVRRICKKLPEVTEVIDGFGHTVFRVRDKSFIIMGGDEERGPTIAIKASKEMQQFLLGQHGPYWKTPYIGQHGWVSTLAQEPDCWTGVEPLIVEGYSLAAPKSLAKHIKDSLK
jgi:predicted DNA-binding protein (MmcQ/YjbR family)